MMRKSRPETRMLNSPEWSPFLWCTGGEGSFDLGDHRASLSHWFGRRLVADARVMSIRAVDDHPEGGLASDPWVR